MNNTVLHLLANTYSAFLPSLSAATIYYTTPTVHSTFLAYAFLLSFFGIFLLSIVAMWKVFTKAGKPGWASIIPIYNLIVLIQIAKKPVWWIFLLFIPIVNIIIGIIITAEIARLFGKGMWFALGLLCIPIVFYPILGFGSSQYLIDMSTDNLGSSDSTSTNPMVIPIILIFILFSIVSIIARPLFLKLVPTKSASTILTQPSSQSASAATVKANLANMRAIGAIFFSTYNSYTGFCSSTELVNGEIAIQAAGGTEMTCHESATQFAAAANIPSQGYWCVDSIGSMTTVSTLPVGTTCQ